MYEHMHDKASEMKSEMKSIYDKVSEAYDDDDDDAAGKDFFDQFTERLLQIQDEDVLKNCALALFVVRPWP